MKENPSSQRLFAGDEVLVGQILVVVPRVTLVDLSTAASVVLPEVVNTPNRMLIQANLLSHIIAPDEGKKWASQSTAVISMILTNAD